MPLPQALAGGTLFRQEVEINVAEIVVGHAVDVKEGRLPHAPGEHYLQIVLVQQRRAILLPVTKPFLAALGRRCQSAAGIAQPQSDSEG